jgi:Uma2 family endonuclease
MRAAKPLGRFNTVGDLIRELGVPARRVRLDPLPGTAGEHDLTRINDRNEGLCELIDGTLVEKAMGFREGFLAALFIEFLGPFVRAKDLGIVVASDSPMRLRRGLVRLPDVSFVSWDQLPNKEIPEESVPSLFPDLAIEIFSRSDTRKEMSRKRREYFRAGCPLGMDCFPEA